MAEITCLGAAMAAGNAVGSWSLQKNFDDENPGLRESRAGREKVFTPKMKEETRSAKFETWKKAVKMSFGWL